MREIKRDGRGVHREDEVKISIPCQHNHPVPAVVPSALPPIDSIRERVALRFNQGDKPKKAFQAIKGEFPQLELRTVQNMYNVMRRKDNTPAFNRILEHLLRCRQDDPEFVSDCFVEEEEGVRVLKRIAWCSSPMLEAARAWGVNYIISDVTYNAVLNRLFLLNVVTEDAGGASRLIFSAIVDSEDAETMAWALELMKKWWGVQPKVLLIDDSASTKKAAADVWPETRVLLCTWHKSKRIVKQLPILHDEDDQKKAFSHYWRLVEESDPGESAKEWLAFLKFIADKCGASCPDGQVDRWTKMAFERHVTPSLVEPEKDQQLDPEGDHEAAAKSWRWMHHLWSQRVEVFACFRANVWTGSASSTGRCEAIHASLKTDLDSKSSAVAVVQATMERAKKEAADNARASSTTTPMNDMTPMKKWLASILHPRAFATFVKPIGLNDVAMTYWHQWNVNETDAYSLKCPSEHAGVCVLRPSPPAFPAGTWPLKCTQVGNHQNDRNGSSSVAQRMMTTRPATTWLAVEVALPMAANTPTLASLKSGGWQINYCSCRRSSRFGLPCICMHACANAFSLTQQECERAFRRVVHSHWTTLDANAARSLAARAATLAAQHNPKQAMSMAEGREETEEEKEKRQAFSNWQAKTFDKVGKLMSIASTLDNGALLQKIHTNLDQLIVEANSLANPPPGVMGHGPDPRLPASNRRASKK